MNKDERLVPKGIVFPFALLTTLFFAWALSNNMTDTMLAAFKRIMSFSDAKTALIQVVCYLFGYGMMAIPGAMFIKKYSYKAGVLLGLGMYVLGSYLFYLPIIFARVNADLCYAMYLFAIWIIFGGLSILETSSNSYVFALGPENTGTRRLNFAQSFNPLGAIAGVVISQMFVLSNLSPLTAAERSKLTVQELFIVKSQELNAVSSVYIIVGIIMSIVLLLIYFTKMPVKRESNKNIDFKGTFIRLSKNKNYVWGIFAQFTYVGAQIGVWSFIIRYVMQTLEFDSIISKLGPNPAESFIIETLRNVDPLSAVFYRIFDFIGIDALMPRTAEQAGATYYIISLILFVSMRFICTLLMKYFKPNSILSALAVSAVILCFGVIYSQGLIGVYCLVGISACMSLMWPTIYGQTIQGLKDDTKIGGAGLVMAIAGGAVLTQIMGLISNSTDGQIHYAYWVPLLAFSVVAYYGLFIGKNIDTV